LENFDWAKTAPEPVAKRVNITPARDAVSAFLKKDRFIS
jgi:hypothetical protein